MSPTSLANRLSVQERAKRVRHVPLHRRIVAVVARVPRRARGLLALVLVLLCLRWLAQSERRTLRHRSPARPTSTSAPGFSFVPSQPRNPSALVHFANGAVQEIFPSRSTGQEGDGRTYERLWEAAPVVRVDIPLGGTLRWMAHDGEEGVLEQARGDDCAEGACVDVKHVRLEMDVLTGLRQLRDGCTLLSSCSPNPD